MLEFRALADRRLRPMENVTYHEGMRELQDLRETRALADRLEKVTMRAAFTDEDKAFIQRCRMFFLATADTQGQPDCSYKGGLPGFVRVLDDRTLAIPDYDGNGQYRSWGNVRVNPHVGLLFVDFETPKRLRVNGTAVVSHDDPLLAEIPGAVFVVRVTGAAHLSQLPALYTQDAAGRRIRLRAATRIHAAGAGMENLRRVQGRSPTRDRRQSKINSAPDI